MDTPKTKKGSKKSTVSKKDVESVEVEETIEISEDKKSRRQYIYVSEFQDQLDEIIATLNEKIEQLSEPLPRNKTFGVRYLCGTRNKLEQLKKRVPKIRKDPKDIKKKRVNGGLQNKIYKVDDQIAEYLKFSKADKDKLWSINDICCAVNTMIKYDPNKESQKMWKHLNPGGKICLQDPEYRRRIIPDKAMIQALDIDEYQRAVEAGEIKKKTKNGVVVQTDPNIYYETIKKLIQPHLIKVVESQPLAKKKTFQEESDEVEETSDPEPSKPKKKNLRTRPS